MADRNTVVTLTDGSSDFSGGVDSIKVTTVKSARNPNGLARNQLAWLDNGGVRDGGILQRTGWANLGTIAPGAAGQYQGGFLYEPDSANPYLILNIGGQTYQVLLDPAVTGGAPLLANNLTASFPGTTMPTNQPQFFYVQGENYLIVQAGDFVTLPLFWDGTRLTRSIGITNNAVVTGTPGVNQIPAAGPMDYYMGRIWYAQGRQYSAGDIVGGPSGVLIPAKRDAILNITENPLVLGGGGFTVPSNAGNIRALFHNANLNSQLGQGQLLIGTRKNIYTLQVPVTRTQWIAANQANQPLQTVVQIAWGPVNDRSVVKVNGDVWFQTLQPAISSMFSSVRNFNQWGNRDISSNEDRLLGFNNRALLNFSSGMLFDDRMWQTALPMQLAQGVAHQAIAPMDFVPISSFGADVNPVWQGMYEGLQILQLFAGDFGGLQRAFAVAVSALDSSFQVWELTDFLRTDFRLPDQTNVNNETRVTWVIETPAWTWGDEFMLKKMVSAELMFDKLFGTADIQVEWRPDMDPCWKLWARWKECSARNSSEDCFNPITYPLVGYREGYRATRTLPQPPLECESATGRPAHIGYQHQLRITIKGWLRLRGLLVHAEEVAQRLYHSPIPC